MMEARTAGKLNGCEGSYLRRLLGGVEENPQAEDWRGADSVQ